jgi:thiol:disulfide interchange protein
MPLCAVIESDLGNDDIWHEDEGAAYAEARSRGLPLLIAFVGRDWCPHCIELERHVFATEAFRAWALERAVLLRVDAPRACRLPQTLASRRRLLREHFGVVGFPTILAAAPPLAGDDSDMPIALSEKRLAGADGDKQPERWLSVAGTMLGR